MSKQASYEIETLTRAVDEMFTAFGFYQKIRPGMTVLLKPNLIMKAAPEAAITTHPHVVAAVARCVKKHGGQPLVAESGGGPYNPAVMKSVFRAMGYPEMAEREGFSLYTACESCETELPRGKRCAHLTVVKPFLQPREALVVNLAKLKTHGMMAFSGAVKNLFGTVPGLLKPELHCRYPEKEPFAEMLVDLCDYIAADFSVIDGIEAMEGDGPTGGEKRFLGALIGSDSPYNADIAAAELIGMKPLDILTLKNAHERGLCAADSAGFTFLGDDRTPLFTPDFKRARSSSVDFIDRLPAFLRPLAKRAATPYPKIQVKSCVGCGKCAESCPQHTIALVRGKAVIDYTACIRCFCCHEMCPMHVIDIRRLSLFKF